MTFAEWEHANAAVLSEDPLWRMQSYRRSCFAVEQAWPDAEALRLNSTTRGIASQLYSAVSSIGGNIAEGYSRGSARDRARFYEYALGSAREARHWYRSGSKVLRADRVACAVDGLNRIIYLLLRTIPRARERPRRDRPH
jgi:four helix bundle protein